MKIDQMVNLRLDKGEVLDLVYRHYVKPQMADSMVFVDDGMDFECFADFEGGITEEELLGFIIEHCKMYNQAIAKHMENNHCCVDFNEETDEFIVCVDGIVNEEK